MRRRLDRRTTGMLVIAVGLLTAGGVALWGFLHPAPPPPGEAEPATEEPDDSGLILRGDLDIEGARITRKDAQGNLIWQVEAGTRIQFDSERKLVEARNVRWRLSVGSGQSWLVDAPHLVFPYEAHRLEFSDGVRIYSPDQTQRFTVPLLYYESDTGKMVGEGPVELVWGESFLKGQRLVVDSRARQTRLAGGVHLRMRFR